MSEKDLPKVTKSISDLAPTRKDLSARIRRVGAKTLVAALGLLGINMGGSPASASAAAEIAPAPLIINRKEKNGSVGLVLQLASNLADRFSLLGHRSHSSHSSHASHSSHYSGTGGGSTSVAPAPATTATPAAVDGSLLADSQTVTGKVTEVQAEKQYLVLKDALNNVHTIHFDGTTLVRLLSPSDQTSTIDALKAFMGSVPVKVGNSVLVHVKTVEGKTKALQITLFEVSK